MDVDEMCILKNTLKITKKLGTIFIWDSLGVVDISEKLLMVSWDHYEIAGGILYRAGEEHNWFPMR